MLECGSEHYGSNWHRNTFAGSPIDNEFVENLDD